MEADRYTHRQEVVKAALRLASAQVHIELHPEDPHAGDDIDLAEDLLDRAIEGFNGD